MNKARWLETGKSALIVLLIVSACLLLRTTGFFSQSSAGSQPSGAGEAQPQDTGAAVTPTVRPLRMAAGSGKDSRCGAMYDSEESSALFSMFSAALGEALGSAGTPALVSEAVWQTALDGESVFFDYKYPQPLRLLASWLGVSGAGSAGSRSADMLILSCENNGVALLFRTGERDYYRCSTAVSAQTVLTRISEAKPNGALFAFESESLSGLESYTLLLEKMPEIQQLSAQSPSFSGSPGETLMPVFGMNAYVASRYPEPDGVDVFVDGDMTLRISSSSELHFRRTGIEDSGAVFTLKDAVSLALEAAGRCMSAAGGDEELVFSGAEPDEDGVYTVYFDYSVNGIPVRPASAEHSFEFVIESGVISRASVILRRYSLSEEVEKILPVKQAAAIASSEESGGLFLVYSDMGNVVKCEWVND